MVNNNSLIQQNYLNSASSGGVNVTLTQATEILRICKNMKWWLIHSIFTVTNHVILT